MPGKRLPFFPMYCDDWLASTSITLMSPSEESGYLRLLLHEWMQDDCTLPDDDAVLAQLSRLGDAWYEGAGEKIRKQFVAENGRLHNPRITEERQKLECKRQASSDAGKIGAAKRWSKKQPKSDGVPNGHPNSEK